MRNSACNLCRSEQRFVICKPRPGQRIPLSIVKCAGCELLYVYPFPSQEELSKIYDQNYFRCDTPIEGGYENYVQDEAVIKRTFRERLSLFLPPQKRGVVLDIGCATGVFLEVMKEKGWEAKGIEISKFAAEAARKKGFTVSGEIFGEGSVPPGTFDLLTMWDVIEHVPDPTATLRAAYHALKPGGFIVLSTPDAGALFARLTGPYWMGFRSVGEHVYFFSRKTLSKMLEKAGFEVVSSTAVGKYLPLDRLITRLCYYTRIFRLLKPFLNLFSSRSDIHVNSGDTMCIVARKKS